MKKIITAKTNIKLNAFLLAVAVLGMVVLINACRKSTPQARPLTQATAMAPAVSPDGKTLTCVYTVAGMRKSADGKSWKVMLNQNEEMFTVTDSTVAAALQNALTGNNAVKISFNPWSGTILQVSIASTAARDAAKAHQAVSGGNAYTIDLNTADEDKLNKDFAVINTTTDRSLTSVIPDMATAQAMFDYIAHQCCAIPGPYAVDYCITFQYCEDGCYARAHKMCWILNNDYHYATQKVFSFANSGSDELCVQAQKWGGCCINWWYHVAPLVTIKTPTGPKAYVFDPAMFDQPVLLTEWLHAQQNPACVPSGDAPHVSMINIQPTSSYWPASGTGYSFDTDPLYASTDTTLVNYRYLVSCP